MISIIIELIDNRFLMLINVLCCIDEWKNFFVRIGRDESIFEIDFFDSFNDVEEFRFWVFYRG